MTGRVSAWEGNGRELAGNKEPVGSSQGQGGLRQDSDEAEGLREAQFEATSWGQLQITALAIRLEYYRAIYYNSQAKESTSKVICLIWKYNNFVS